MRTNSLQQYSATSMVLALVALFTTFASGAQAATTSQCVSQHTGCLQNCNRYPSGPFFNSCLQRCGSQLDTCLSSALTDTPGKVDTPPDPKKPRPTDNSAPTTGKNGSKASKAGDTPTGGGTFQVRKSGAGNGDPTPSNGGNGPSFRSNGRN